MKLTLDLIGKKVYPKRMNDNDYDYLLVTGILSNDGVPYIYGLGIKDNKIVGEHTPDKFNGIGSERYDIFSHIKGLEVKEFDFSKFGCNQDYVKELIKFLDAKYVLREETK